MLGALSLSVVIDSEVERSSHTCHLHLEAEFVEDLSKSVREGRQGHNVDVSVPFDTAQLLYAAIQCLWRRGRHRRVNKRGLAALGAVSADQSPEARLDRLAC